MKFKKVKLRYKLFLKQLNFSQHVQLDYSKSLNNYTKLFTIISTTPIPKCSFHIVCKPTLALENKVHNSL